MRMRIVLVIAVCLAASLRCLRAQDESEIFGTQQNPESVGAQNESATVGAQDKLDTVGAQNELETVDAQDEPETAAVHNEPETAAVHNEPETAGAQNEPETAAVHNEPETAGAKNEPETAAFHNEPETAGAHDEHETARAHDYHETAGARDKPETLGAQDDPEPKVPEALPLEATPIEAPSRGAPSFKPGNRTQQSNGTHPSSKLQVEKLLNLIPPSWKLENRTGQTNGTHKIPGGVKMTSPILTPVRPGNQTGPSNKKLPAPEKNVFSASRRLPSSSPGDQREPSNDTDQTSGERVGKFVPEKLSKKGISTGESSEILTDFLELIKKFYQKWSRSQMPENDSEPRTETHPGLAKMDSRGGAFSWSNATWANLSKFAGKKYFYSSTIAQNVTIKEGAFVVDGRNIVVVRNNVHSLEKSNVIQCTSVYDFSNTTALAVHVPDNRLLPCLMLHTDLTFSGVREELAATNGSKITKNNRVTLYVNANPLTTQQAHTVKETNPSVRFACASRAIHVAETHTANTEQPSSATLKAFIVGLDSVLLLDFPLDVLLGHFNLTSHETPEFL